jgi:hypothetical protein
VFKNRKFERQPTDDRLLVPTFDRSLPTADTVLVLRNQGYDFTVAGEVSDPAKCLERTEAANGIFYSDCEKKKN